MAPWLIGPTNLVSFIEANWTHLILLLLLQLELWCSSSMQLSVSTYQPLSSSMMLLTPRRQIYTSMLSCQYQHINLCQAQWCYWHHGDKYTLVCSVVSINISTVVKLNDVIDITETNICTSMLTFSHFKILFLQFKEAVLQIVDTVLLNNSNHLNPRFIGKNIFI